jgi:glucose-6-phosphate 1-dehydrogenase
MSTGMGEIQPSPAPTSNPPLTIVIFGASGDLTHRKLMPALFDLMVDGLLHPETRILGVARSPKSHEGYREEIRASVQTFARSSDHLDLYSEFEKRIFYFSMTFDDSRGYTAVRSTLLSDEFRKPTGGNILFYLATQPSYFVPIIRNLGEFGLSKINEDGETGPSSPFTRIIVEKPFGRDLSSAKELNREVLQVFREHQVFRIDHYLGKETVQNIVVFRLSNPVFGALWTNIFVRSVHISVSETVGVEGRGTYFEEAGILRDMVQNHLFQLMTLTAMEPPVAFEAESIRDEKVKVIRSLKPVRPEDVSRLLVRGQYTVGEVDGVPVPGYRNEPKIPATSDTSTFACMKVEIQSWRWAGVPFYLTAGKRMSRRETLVRIVFKDFPFALFRLAGCPGTVPNELLIRIQPNEGISLRFGIKRPGGALLIDPVEMNFSYQQAYRTKSPEAYERLLHDAIIGDSTLFARNDEVETSWSFIAPFLGDISKSSPLRFYTAGTDGPDEQDRIHDNSPS